MPLLTINLNGTEYVRVDAARIVTELALSRERLRIRRELLAAALEECDRYEKGEAIIAERVLMAALDRICPEE